MRYGTGSVSGDRPSRLFDPVLASDEVLNHGDQISRINRLGDAHLEAGIIPI
jgi:hypothetical protein